MAIQFSINLHNIPQPNLGLPRTHAPFNSAIDTVLAIWFSSILYTCPNHLRTLQPNLLVTSLIRSTRQLSCYSISLTNLFVRVTPTKLFKHIHFFSLCTSRTPCLCSIQCVGTITPSYTHFFALIRNSRWLNTVYRAPQVL